MDSSNTLRAWTPGDHDDFCERSFLRNARCTCGATEAEQIVDDVTAAFADELKEISRAQG